MTRDQILAELISLFQFTKANEDIKSATRLLYLIGLELGMFQRRIKLKPVHALSDDELDALLVGSQSA